MARAKMEHFYMKKDGLRSEEEKEKSITRMRSIMKEINNQNQLGLL